MADKERIIVGLEVGTAKVCAVVGEVLADGNIKVIGVGQAPSQGVRKGEIVDMPAAMDSIQAAIAVAEDNADVEIHSVCVNASGGHLRSFNNRGSVVITNDDRQITDEEVKDVLYNAKAVNTPVDHAILHAIRQRFYVDGQDGIQNPVGMLGARLEADVHIVHGVRTRLQNPVAALKRLELLPEHVALSSLASALAVLTTEQQQLGALVIDMGAGTTDFIAYRDGAVQHSGVLAVGGDHITNDIAIGLHIPMNRAEKLKLEHGSLDPATPEQIISLPREIGLPDRQVSRAQLCRIMHLRVEETLQLIRKEMEKQNLLNYLGAGVFLTGGCARLAGLDALAVRVFELPVTIGHSHTVNGPTTTIENPEYSTAIGLVRYASKRQQEPTRPTTLINRLHHFIAQVRALFM